MWLLLFLGYCGSHWFLKLLRVNENFFTPFTRYFVQDLFHFTANYDIIKCPSEVKSENESNKPRVCNST